MSQVLTELKEEHQTWLTKIRSWEQEIAGLSAQNAQIISDAMTSEARSMVDHFDNRFTIELSRLDSMKHNIKVHGGAIGKGQEDIDEFAKFFEILKNDFMAFQQSLS